MNVNMNVIIGIVIIVVMIIAVIRNRKAVRDGRKIQKPEDWDGFSGNQSND
jgi:hypothetical protein